MAEAGIAALELSTCIDKSTYHSPWLKLQIKAALRDGLWKTLAIPENILDRTVLSLEKHPVTSLLIVFFNRIVNEWNPIILENQTVLQL